MEKIENDFSTNVKTISRLCVGTANFGLNYGLANKNGKVNRKNLVEILQVANANGINTLDTAQAYGDSEARLRAIHKSRFNIVTKIGGDPNRTFRKNEIISNVVESLNRLGVDHLNALLLHRPELLLGEDGPRIAVELNYLKEMGLVERIGVSIYAPEVLSEILKVMHLDIVQAPFNVFDRRILKSGWTSRLRDAGTEIHIRSVFLQGLLLMNSSNIPPYFLQNWGPLFANWFNFQRKFDASSDEIALDFALQQSWIERIVVGVDNALQLDRLLQIEASKRFKSLPQFDVNDIDLIDPSRWRLL